MAEKKYRYQVSGTNAQGGGWSVAGEHVSKHSPGPFVLDEIMGMVFLDLTNGKAVYGKPGEGCIGPYKIVKVELEVLP